MSQQHSVSLLPGKLHYPSRLANWAHCLVKQCTCMVFFYWGGEVEEKKRSVERAKGRWEKGKLSDIILGVDKGKSGMRVWRLPMLVVKNFRGLGVYRDRVTLCICSYEKGDHPSTDLR